MVKLIDNFIFEWALIFKTKYGPPIHNKNDNRSVKAKYITTSLRDGLRKMIIMEFSIKGPHTPSQHP